MKKVLNEWNLSDENLSQDNALGRYLNHLKWHPETSITRILAKRISQLKRSFSHFQLENLKLAWKTINFKLKIIIKIAILSILIFNHFLQFLCLPKQVS